MFLDKNLVTFFTGVLFFIFLKLQKIAHMLSILKKYQKFIFIVIAFFICISVMFMGILPKSMASISDPILFHTVSGKKIKRSHYEGLKALLTTNNGEAILYGQNLGMHFFPEDVFTQNLIKPKLLYLIAEKKQAELQEFWKAQHDKEVHYKPYAHPEATFISAESIWIKHAPQIPDLLKKMKAETDLKKIFELRTELFLEENQFSPFALWRFLSEQQSQYQWMGPDEQMIPLSLSLFNYRSFQDWFGDKMIDYVCQFILHTSSVAKERGYGASYKEAEEHLVQLNQRSFDQIQFLGLKEFPDATSYFNAKLARLGMNKMQMVAIWREVLTFQNFFNEASHAAMLDNFTTNDFEHFASEQVEINKYLPPAPLHFKSLTELAKFEAYLQALGKSADDLRLDFTMNSLDEIEKNYPQLIEQNVEMAFKEVDAHGAAVIISVQDIWNWKANRDHTTELVARFPKLKLDHTMSDEEYMAAFDELDYFTNMQIDQHVRQILLKNNDEWLAKAYENAPLVKGVYCVRKNGQKLPFKGLDLSAKKEEFLKNFFTMAQNASDNNGAPITISFDDRYYYQIQKIHAKDEAKLVDYQNLVSDKTAEKLLHQVLAKVHKTSSFQGKEFERVKDSVMKEWLAPIKSAILRDYEAVNGEKPHQESDAFYCDYRLYQPMREALHYLSHHSDEETFALNSLWTVMPQDETLIRHQSNGREIDQLLTHSEGDWTSVEVKQHSPSFAKVVSKKHDSRAHPMQKQLRKEIVQEIICSLAKEMLDQMKFEDYTINK